MVRPDQIPDEVVEAALEAFAHASGLGILPNDEDDEDWHDDLWNGMRAAIAAAINAWPGASEIVVGLNKGSIILPLPTEPSDD